MIAPRANPELRGQEEASAKLRDSVRAGRLHHAWLICGPPGIGKATLGYRFTRWLLSGAISDDLSLAPSHAVFRRIAAGSHPDLLVIERRFDERRKRLQSEIVVDTVREAADFLHLTPFDGGWRIVLVDGAEAMNRNAANSLLKLLEDPPDRAIWLLVSHAPGRLLPTVRSRCRRLDCEPLDDRIVEDLVLKALPDLASNRRHALVSLAGGSIGRALEMAQGDALNLSGLATEILNTTAISPPRAAAISDQVVRTEDGFVIFIDQLRVALGRLLRTAARDGIEAVSAPIIVQRGLDGAASLWQELARLEGEVDGLNLDQRAAILLLIEQLRTA